MARLEDYLSQRRGRQTRLAKQLGLSSGTLSLIRSGQRRPSPDLAKRIEAATDGEVRATSLLGLEEAGAPFDHELAIPLSDGRWAATVNTDGSLHLPPELVAAMGLEPDERLVVRPEAEGMRINSSDQALKRIQARWKALVPEGVSLADELIADRRAEAARE